MTGGTDSANESSARRVVRIAGRYLRPSRWWPVFVAVARQWISIRLSRAPLEYCAVCESRAARVITVTRATSARGERGKTARMRICRVCGHVGNPENVHDYRTFEQIDEMAERPRIGTTERRGREFHMAAMAIDILGRDDIEVLIFGAGRSFDNHHIAALPQVRHVAIADIMRLRDDAEFIDANVPAPRQFPVVVASEVVEHFLDPRSEFAHLFGYLEPGGLLVCSTNLYDGGALSRQRYAFKSGHTSYYSSGSLTRLAKANGCFVDFRVPFVATGYGGSRKRYVLFTTSAAVMEAIARYFSNRRYAPSESPTADRELAEAKELEACRACERPSDSDAAKPLP